MQVSEILKARRNRANVARDRRVQELYEKHPEFRVLREDSLKKSRNLALLALSASPQKVEEGKKALFKARKKEKKAREQLGLKEDFFQPDYFCKKCQDTGFVNGKSCSCREALKREYLYDCSSLATQFSHQNFETFDLNFFRQDRQEGELESPREHMAEVYQQMKEEYCQYFGEGSPSLYFYGPAGTGKTFMVSCIAKNLIDKGFSVFYQTSGEILDFLVNYSFSYQQERKRMEEKRKLIYDSDLLALDDLGSEYVNQATLSQLFRLINSRLLRKKPTLLSSNLRPDQLQSAYDQRIRSRIAGSYILVEFYGSDLRERP